MSFALSWVSHMLLKIVKPGPRLLLWWCVYLKENTYKRFIYLFEEQRQNRHIHNSYILTKELALNSKQIFEAYIFLRISKIRFTGRLFKRFLVSQHRIVFSILTALPLSTRQIQRHDSIARGCQTIWFEIVNFCKTT